MSAAINVLLLVVTAVFYFAVLAGLFKARARLGIGAFFCALGAMHFVETYLATTVYVALPFGIVASPGSAVLFTGKLMLLLLVYIRQDAVVVRQPMYGLLLGNVLLIAVVALMRLHQFIPVADGRLPDLAFLNEMGALMAWGTVVLFADCILIILMYERARGWFGEQIFPRLLISGVVAMTFDQVCFFAGLYLLTDASLPILVGGWVAKLGAVAVYATLGWIYLCWLERPRALQAMGAPRVADVFDMLTYRERYEALIAQSGRDTVTGALDRSRLESQGRRMVEEAALSGRPASLLLIDIDHFKSFNDQYGHAAGDAVLRRIAEDITTTVRASDLLFRFGGEEFVVICEGLASTPALALGERIRRAVASHPVGPRVTVSIGVASCAEDACDYDNLFAIADQRLYAAKGAGRNCVVGERRVSGDKPPVRLAYAG
jgi:diguanylate cyclase (GGDEF)-like protein